MKSEEIKKENDENRRRVYEQKQKEIDETNKKIKIMKNYKEKYNDILSSLKSSNDNQITTSNPLRNEINDIKKFFNSNKNLGNLKKKESIIKFLDKNIKIIDDSIKKEEKNIRIPPKTSGNIMKLSNNDQTSVNSNFKQNVWLFYMLVFQ